MIVDPGSQRIADTVFRQEQKCLPHVPLLFYLRGNFSCFPLADAFDLYQKFRLLLHDPECVPVKMVDDPGSQCGAYPFDRPGSQITFDRDIIFRRKDAIMLDSQLFPI